MRESDAHLWLKQRGVCIEQNFYETFEHLVDDYMLLHPGMTLSELYSQLGISKQSLYWWRKHHDSVQSKHRYKQNFFIKVAEFFKLSENQAEMFANQAGMSLKRKKDFNVDFRNMVLSFRGGIKHLCESTLISERMMEYFMCNSVWHIPSKPCVTAVAIALGQSELEIQSFH